MPPASNRTDRRRERSRRALLDGGRAVIARRGVDLLTVSEVTEAADVGRGSFYNHFASMQAFVEAVAHEATALVASRALVAPEEHPDPAVRASLADQRFIALAVEDPPVAKLVVNLADVVVFRDAVRPFARGVLEQGVAEGRFRIPQLDMALTVLASSAFAVMRDILAGTAPADAPKLHAQSMLMLFGLPEDEASSIVRR